MTDLWENDAITLAGMLRSRDVSAREVIAAHIERIEAADGAVNAVVTRCFEQAMAKAAARTRPWRGARSRVCCTDCRSRTRISWIRQASAPRTGRPCSRNTCPNVTSCW